MPRFQPGVSGNPGGRPRSNPELAEAARGAATEAVLLLLGLARDHGASWSQRRRACLDLARLAYGRRAVCPAAAELLAGLRPSPVVRPDPPENRPAPVASGGRSARRFFVPPR